MTDTRTTWGSSPDRHHTAAVVVGLLHMLLLLAWWWALGPQARLQGPPSKAPAVTWLTLAERPTPAPVVPPAGVSTDTDRDRARASAVPARRAAQARPPPAAPVAPAAAITESLPTSISSAAAPTPPASAPLTSPPSIMDSEATRQAIREIGRQALLSERAADATGQPLRSRDAQLAAAAAQAGKGDCLKGEYLGGGAGLLSLPFLAVAAARGECSK